MTHRTPSVAILLAAAVFFVSAPAFAQGDPDVFVSTGPTSEILIGPAGTGFVQLFTAKGGFKPEEMALAGDGNLYICDASSSEIFRFDPANPGTGVVTIYDRASAVSPNNPEQPKGCTIAGNDLLFLSRNGRGRGAKTGLWAIQNVTTSPTAPTLLLGLDAVGGVSGQGLAVNYDGRVFFTFGTEVWVATPTPGVGRIDDESDFRIWGNTAGEGFGIAAKGVLAVLPSGAQGLETQVFVAAKFSGVVEVLREVGGVGTTSGCSVIDVPDMPNGLEFDGAGDLWLTASGQSSGRRGSVHEVDNPVCSDVAPEPVERAAGLSAAVGIALTPSGSDPITLTGSFVGDKSGAANMCNSLFNLDQVTSACQDTWTISCRLMPQAEFGIRTVATPFLFTSCADFPGASGNCAEIRITQTDVSSECSEGDILAILANWQFFSLSNLDHPGLLYSPDDFGTGGPEANPFDENILVDFNPVPVPSDPVDPRATGSRDAWGSGIVVVDNAPNRPPTAVLSVEPLVAQCNEPVTLDGLASFDNDWNVSHADSVTRYIFSLDNATVQDGPLFSYEVDTLLISSGAHTASLQVFDEGWDTQGVLVSQVVEVDFTSASDTGPPTFSTPVRLKDLGHPQVTITVDGDSGTMWPPNHEMVPFELIVEVTDECDFSCEIIATSNEPANGTGDGDIAPDVEVTDTSLVPKTLNLRSERAQNGTGREYTITVVCTDEVGNVTTSDPIVVTVASSQGGN